MTKALYDKGREGFLDGSIDWDTNDIRAILVDAGAYAVDLAAHDNLDDIPAGARIAVSGALTGKTVTAGVADADDVAFAAVAGASVEAIVIYKHTGTESTSRLIGYVDEVTGFPYTPTGADVVIGWPAGATKIFKL